LPVLCELPLAGTAQLVGLCVLFVSVVVVQLEYLKMTARWNDELTCKYVELYKEHEYLWNMNSTLYKRKDARQSALEEIVRKMGLESFTTEDAKQKIKSLRATCQHTFFKLFFYTFSCPFYF
jgi:hypothetical protein